MKTFCSLLSLYESQLTNCESDNFPTLLERTTSDPKVEIKPRIGKCVTVRKYLKAEFDKRFQDLASRLEINEVEKRLQVELDTMQCNFSLESRFKLLSLQEFYKSLDKARFLMLRRQAKRMMCQFCSTYICEQVFSTLNFNQNKFRFCNGCAPCSAVAQISPAIALVMA